MAIKVNITGAAYTGKTVTFPAPCDCASVTDGLSINGEIYTVCDAMGKCVTGVGGTWAKGAQVSVILDCENKKAFIISTGSYAPAGYGGFGEATAAVTCSTEAEFETYLDNLLATINNFSSVRFSVHLPFIVGAYFFGVCYKRGTGESIVELASYVSPSALNSSCQLLKNKVSTGWQPLEWVNPPMIVDKEYRTTERHNGKAIYRKMDQFGNRYWRTEGGTIWRKGSNADAGISAMTGTKEWAGRPISGPGWLRIAKLPGYGGSSASAFVRLHHQYSSGGPHELLFYVTGYNNGMPKITIISNTHHACTFYTKIRLVLLADGDCALDVYYARSEVNAPGTRFISMHDAADYQVIPVDFEAVAETVSGETVITEQAVDANAGGGNLVTDTMLGSLGVASIEPFTYTGTGTYGVTTPNSLTFAKPPKMLIITHANGQHLSVGAGKTPIMNCEILSTSYVFGHGFVHNSTQTYAKKSADGTTISWYSAHSSGYILQFNDSGTVYNGFAFF